MFLKVSVNLRLMQLKQSRNHFPQPVVQVGTRKRTQQCSLKQVE